MGETSFPPWAPFEYKTTAPETGPFLFGYYLSPTASEAQRGRRG